jgi:hypothetical protein
MPMRVLLLIVVLIQAIGLSEPVSCGNSKTNNKGKPSSSQKVGVKTEQKAVYSAKSVAKSSISVPEKNSAQSSSAEKPLQTAICQPVPSSAVEGYTSLVVDATGLKLVRSMCPKIRRSDGSEIWGTLKNLTDKDYDFLLDNGLVAYVSTLQEAFGNVRCGSKPLVVKALSTSTPTHSDVVVSDDDAVRILNENSKSKFLEKFNVIFVGKDVPPPPPPTSTEDAGTVTDSTSEGSTSQL